MQSVLSDKSVSPRTAFVAAFMREILKLPSPTLHFVRRCMPRHLVSCCNPGHTRLTVLFPGLPSLSRYQKGKTSLDFTEASDSEWQWHQLGHMQVCTSLQTDNHASTQPFSFLQAGCHRGTTGNETGSNRYRDSRKVAAGK